MRECADCARLRHRISDLNNELLVLRIAARVARNESNVGQKGRVRAAKRERQRQSSRGQSGSTSSSSPVFTS